MSQLQKAQQTAVARQDAPESIGDFLRANFDWIKAIVPSGTDPERLSRIALAQINTTRALGQCSTYSLFGAIVAASGLGLSFDRALGEAYLVPFKGEATLIIGYRGLLSLVYRSGQVSSAMAHTVHAEDDFTADLAAGTVSHRPARGERGEAVEWYAIVRLKDGGTIVDVMSRDDVERVRQMSQGRNSDAWSKHFDEMARKTVLRRCLKYAPKSAEVAAAIGYDETTIRADSRVRVLVTQAPQLPEAPPDGETLDAEP